MTVFFKSPLSDAMTKISLELQQYSLVFLIPSMWRVLRASTVDLETKFTA